MKRPRVVHVVAAGEIGGAERMVADLASRPEASGAEHAIALFAADPRLARVFRDAGVRVHHAHRSLGGSPGRFLWHTLGPGPTRWITSVLHHERADIVQLHTVGSQVVGTRAALRAGARVLRTEHSTRAFEDGSCWPFARWSLVRAQASVAVSEHVREVAARRAPWAADKLHIVRNGVDVGRFAPRQAAVGAPFTFVSVARLEPRKGIDLALEALARVPAARLDVVGDGEERPMLEREARSRRLAERVVFHGHLDDPRPLVAGADAALCTSREEGLGLALLEAMAMGKPVVGFAVGGVPEIVAPGAATYLCPAGDHEGLVRAMGRAVAERAALPAVGRVARARVVERFSADAMCRAYGAHYAALTASGRA